MPVDTVVDVVDRDVQGPVLRILRGRVSGEELAAITVALLRHCREGAVAAEASRTAPVAAPRRACWRFVPYRAPSAWAAA
ncbi:hypothetical protein [Kitasatospora sp. NPDC058218]|uniref:hypothetical protein n=1 Tax=Kitasatospora sp. NPDC058218 TaxID=3346385 RepID=UPI0036D844EB